MPVATTLPSKYRPMDLAHALVQRSVTPSAHPGIYLHGGIWYVYEEPTNTWKHYAPDEFRTRILWPVLNTFEVEVYQKNQLVGTTRLNVTRNLVAEAEAALESLCSLPSHATIPYSIGSPITDPKNSITFLDSIVTIGGGEGEPVSVVPRDSRWLCSEVVPCEYNPDAICPTWLQCLDDWAVRDKDHADQKDIWIDILQRWFGYCLLPHNDYARVLLMYGKVRAGKGTITKVLRSLFTREGYVSCSLRGLAGRFGMSSLLRSRVISINEVSSLKDEDAENATYTLKSIIGQDPVSIERKYMSNIENVVLPGKIMMQANQIPNLPNKGAGLSSKIIMLPFDNSFLNREDTDLESKLLKELPGIANWAVEGARKLVAASGTDRWPTLRRGEEAMDDYHTVNNPLDMFLRARFQKGGWVRTEEVWRQFESWQKATGMRLHIPRNMLMVRLEQESSWDLKRVRKAEPLTGGRYRAMIGLHPKEKDDEI
jgi:P4 family phage/plasmid primase-like protien